jgi:LysR family transcriptional regulator, mexEF-oprN operon transcriptional activator
MHDNYGRDLDLNLLRVFSVVADGGSVTEAAARLYLTQPAVSAALSRLSRTLGVPLFVRQGRRLVLTERGKRLHAAVQLNLQALVDAAFVPARFDVKTSERTVRLGLSDTTELWLLPSLLRALEKQAPRVRIISVPVQFRTVADAFDSRKIELGITVADELPAAIRRQSLFMGDFVCLFDPRHARLGPRLTEAEYFALEHVVVSYNADLRGIVEDFLHKTRRVRCSVSSFANLGALIEGSSLLATVPRLVAHHIRSVRPALRTLELPLPLEGASMELLWPAASDDDELGRFLRERIVEIARTAAEQARPEPRPRRRPRRA